MAHVTVWVQDWQMQCCGDPFAIGQDVTWAASHSPSAELAGLGRDDALAADYIEDHHDTRPDTAPVSGRVAGIRAVFCRWSPDSGSIPRVLTPQPGSGWAVPVRRADGREPTPAGAGFLGYLVDLDPSPHAG